MSRLVVGVLRPLGLVVAVVVGCCLLLLPSATSAVKMAMWKSRANLPEARSDYALASHKRTNRAFIVGGCRIPFTENGGCVDVADTVWEYNARTDKYKNLSILPSPRWRHAAAIIGDGKFLVVFGGFVDGAETVRNATDVFNLHTHTWATFPGGDINTVSDLNSFILDGALYASGGYSQPNYDVQSSVYKYLGQGNWKNIATLKLPRGDGLAAVTLGTAFLAGGWNPSENTTNMELFSRLQSSRLLSSPEFQMVPPRLDAAFCSSRNQLVAVGGETGSWPVTFVDSAIHISLFKLRNGKLSSRPKGWSVAPSSSKGATRRFRCQCASLLGSSIHVFGGQVVNVTSNEFQILAQVDQLVLP